MALSRGNHANLTPESEITCFLFAESETESGEYLCDSDSCFQSAPAEDSESKAEQKVSLEDQQAIKLLAQFGKRLNIKEQDFMDDSKQPELKPWMRDQLVEFTILLSEDLGIDTHTAMVCLACFDRVLCAFPVSKCKAQCLLVTCFWIALKFGEWEGANPGADYLAAATGHACTAQDIKKIELIVLEVLHWEVSAVSPCTFVASWFPVVTKGLDAAETDRISRLSDFLITLSARTNIATCAFAPDVVGAASLLGAAIRHKPSSLDTCLAALSAVSNIPPATILRCHQQLQTELESHILPCLNVSSPLLSPISGRKRPAFPENSDYTSEQDLKRAVLSTSPVSVLDRVE